MRVLLQPEGPIASDQRLAIVSNVVSMQAAPHYCQLH